MMTRIVKTARPTAKLPPTTNAPKASMTLPAASRALVAVQQHDARRGDVQREPQQGRDEQDGREDAELERPRHVHDGQDDDERERDVEGEQHVERERRQRQHHHREDHDERDGHAEAAAARSCAGRRVSAAGPCASRSSVRDGRRVGRHARSGDGQGAARRSPARASARTRRRGAARPRRRARPGSPGRSRLLACSARASGGAS